MFNKEEEAKAIQKELLSKVKSACHENGIPFIFLAAVKDDGKTTGWLADGIPAGEIDGITLSDDRIKRALAVLNGFEDETFENRNKASEMIFELPEEEFMEDGIDDDDFNAGLVNEKDGD